MTRTFLNQSTNERHFFFLLHSLWTFFLPFSLFYKNTLHLLFSISMYIIYTIYIILYYFYLNLLLEIIIYIILYNFYLNLLSEISVIHDIVIFLYKIIIFFFYFLPLFQIHINCVNYHEFSLNIIIIR